MELQQLRSQFAGLKAENAMLLYQLKTWKRLLWLSQFAYIFWIVLISFPRSLKIFLL